jgi:cell division protein FtsW (lipid II flippase)
MKKKLFFSALLLFCCGIALPLMAQMPIEVQTSALEKTMFANGKMNVVFSVVIIIVLGLLAYWLYLRRLISIYSQAISEQK